VTFRVLCFQQLDNIGKVFVPDKSGLPTTELPLYTGGISKDFKETFYDGKVRLVLPHKNPATGADTGKVVAEGNLASGSRQIFLLLPLGKNGITYQVHAMDDDKKAFPMGAIRMLNMSPSDVRVKLAGSALPALAPGKTAIYPQVRKVDDWNMYMAEIFIAKKGNEWLPVATQSWKSSDAKRDFVIVLIDPDTNQPSVRLYKDLPPWSLPDLSGKDVQ